MKISVVLKEMKRSLLVTPLMPKKNWALAGNTEWKGHLTDNYHILKSYTNTLIQQGDYKNFVAYKRYRTRNPNKRVRM